METITFQKLVELVCTRPRMFVRDGGFQGAVAYLDGYDTAVGILTGNGRDGTDLGGFRLWLAQKLWELEGTARNLAWWSYIERLYPDDETRFQQLPALFNEYLGQRDQPSKTAKINGDISVTLTLEIPPEIEGRLQERAIQNGQAVADYLLTLVEADVLEEIESAEPTDQADFEEAAAAIREALADFDAGDRGMLLEDYRAQVRGKQQVRSGEAAA